MASPGGFVEAERPTTLPERTLGDLLNETFAIYGRKLSLVLGIVALVQVPAGLAGLVFERAFEPTVAVVAASVLQGFAGFYVYGALAFAAGQLYSTGRMDIKASYSRVWWRVVSLSLLALIVLTAAVLGAALFFLVFPLVLLLVAIIYWSVAVPAMMVQGVSAAESLRRSYRLVRGSWWRVFGISLVVGLVTVGLMILATVPFLAVSALAGLAGMETLGQQVLRLGSIAGGVLAAPVPAISGTLLYYDLRVRGEGFDLASLSEEMGFTPSKDQDQIQRVSIHSEGMG